MWVRLFRGRLPRLFTNSFNSRTRVGATSHHRPAGLPHEVSIHAPVWVRQEGLSSMSSYEGFQFTHPCGCDLHQTINHEYQQSFNSRTRVGATFMDWLMLVRRGSFNSRTRVGATVSARYVRGEGWVSIHAPVWVRLVVAGEAVKNYDVSIHAPVWVRQTEPKPEAQEEEVSIHAPVWVRRSFVGKRIFIFGFNSRTRVGATPADELATSIYTVSIHAPVWVRPYMTELSFWFRRFQFTHPCGCDCGLVTVESVDKVSIHAPVWVRPSGMRLGYVKRWVSIHAPVWVRLKSGFGTYFFLRFQFTHPCGCDMNKVYRMKRTQMFQFTHPCGCDASRFSVQP